MKKYTSLLLAGLLFCCGQKDAKDPVEPYDRFDLANTIDTTRGSYNPQVDSTYVFPTDSADIVTVRDTSHYSIKTIIFPVRNKYIIGFIESADRKEKVRYRDYKLQVEISDHEGLFIKKVLSKYDFPDSILPEPDYYFLREAKFKRLQNDEFMFELKLICYGDDGCFPPNVRYYVHLVDGIRFETYSNLSYDSTLQIPERDIN